MQEADAASRLSSAARLKCSRGRPLLLVAPCPLGGRPPLDPCGAATGVHARLTYTGVGVGSLCGRWHVFDSGRTGHTSGRTKNSEAARSSRSVTPHLSTPLATTNHGHAAAPAVHRRRGQQGEQSPAGGAGVRGRWRARGAADGGHTTGQKGGALLNKCSSPSHFSVGWWGDGGRRRHHGGGGGRARSTGSNEDRRLEWSGAAGGRGRPGGRGAGGRCVILWRRGGQAAQKFLLTQRAAATTAWAHRQPAAAARGATARRHGAASSHLAAAASRRC